MFFSLPTLITHHSPLTTHHSPRLLFDPTPSRVERHWYPICIPAVKSFRINIRNLRTNRSSKVLRVSNPRLSLPDHFARPDRSRSSQQSCVIQCFSCSGWSFLLYPKKRAFEPYTFNSTPYSALFRKRKIANCVLSTIGFFTDNNSARLRCKMIQVDHVFKRGLLTECVSAIGFDILSTLLCYTHHIVSYRIVSYRIVPNHTVPTTKGV